MTSDLVFEPNVPALLARREGEHIEEYGRFQQHLVLLEDAGRIGAFARALDRLRGDCVVDIGAGTGVLSMLALKKGFEHAVLVEPSRKMAAYARHLAASNGAAHRVTVLESTLEALRPGDLPARIDLVITETLSSLLFGFGSWDALPSLVARLPDRSRIVPRRGRLWALPVTECSATRGPGTDGLAALAAAGVKVDLFERTFRSGGNVFDKRRVLVDLETTPARPVLIASFDFDREQPYDLGGAACMGSADREFVGLTTFWEVDLVDGEDGPVRLGCLDPTVTSWYPYYVPFSAPVRGGVPLRLRLVPRDAPYKYAFQFESAGRPLTHVLYW